MTMSLSSLKNTNSLFFSNFFLSLSQFHFLHVAVSTPSRLFGIYPNRASTVTSQKARNRISEDLIFKISWEAYPRNPSTEASAFGGPLAKPPLSQTWICQVVLLRRFIVIMARRKQQFVGNLKLDSMVKETKVLRADFTAVERSIWNR